MGKWTNLFARYCLLINLWGFVMWPNFIGKVAKIYLEGCQNLLGRLPTFIGKVAELYWEGCQTLWVNGQTYLQDIVF